ncbi:MAG: aminoglycoside phosphotransferase family protein [Actinomycetota bacterium]
MQVPELVRLSAAANAGGAAWLRALPSLVDELVARWGLTLGTPYEDASAGFVVPADRHGEPCVLKVPLRLEAQTGNSVTRAVAVHRLADGRGCARLIDVVAEPPALLMERLGPNLHAAGWQLEELLDAIADTLVTFWRPAADLDMDLPTGRDRVEQQAVYIERMWHDLAHPCERRLVDLVLEQCVERADAHDPGSAVIAHGDAHGWNTLEADGGGCKFVDPEGVIAEPALDLAAAMREYNEPLLAGDTQVLVRDRAARLAERAGVDVDAVLAWANIERLATGLANLHDFGPVQAEPFFEVGARLAR